MTPEESAIQLAEIALKQDLTKIGLPALITAFTAIVGAVSAYWIAKLKYKHEGNKAMEVEKLTTLKDIVAKVNNYSSSLVSFSLIRRSLSDPPTEDEKKQQDLSEVTYIQNQGDLALALALLSVIGEEDARAKLRAYEDSCITYMHGLDGYNEEQHAKSSNYMSDTRLEFFASLNSNYSKITDGK